MRDPKRLVLKLGGSVLTCEEDYVEHSHIIKGLLDRVQKMYIVLSAQKGETERLIDCSGYDGDLRRALRGEHSDIEFPGIADYLLQGEIDSVKKLEHYLRKVGLDPFLLLQGEGVHPVVANSSNVYGVLDMQRTRQRRQVLRSISNKVVLVAGFGGETPLGEKVLLGKNSSDLVAALTAYVDGSVEEVVYFKDVQGVYLHYGRAESTLVDEMSVEEARNFDFRGLLDRRSIDYTPCNIRIQHYKAPFGSGTLIKI
jgi:aspartokinase